MLTPTATLIPKVSTLATQTESSDFADTNDMFKCDASC